MSSASWLFSRAYGALAPSRLASPASTSSNAIGQVIIYKSKAYRKQIESCMMEHGCVIGSLGTMPRTAELIVQRRRVRRRERSCTKLRHIDAAQFCAMLSPPSITGAPTEGEFAERSAVGSQRNPASPIIVETRGEPLKFVVNSRLPTGPFRRQHYITESGRRHEFCCGGVVQRGLELKGGRLPGGSASFQLRNPQRELR
jgi:hypothetical protein